MKFETIYPSNELSFFYDNQKIKVYVSTTVGKKDPILEINCTLDLDENLDSFPFTLPVSSTKPVVEFFTNLAEFSLVKRPFFLIQLKNDIENALNITPDDFKKYKIYFDMDLGIGNVHMYYELPGQPPARGEHEGMFLVTKMQADLYFTLNNLFYKPEYAKLLKEIFKDYENFFISWAINYATDGKSAVVYSSKHPQKVNVKVNDIIWK